jgi:general secretion pathway protein L
VAERILVRKLNPGLWQWRAVSTQNLWLSDVFYTGDINLLAETAKGKVCWLILDGRSVVSQTVNVGIKDRKLLPKLVPFSIEESVVTSLEDLVFSYGPLVDGIVQVSYTNEAKVAAQIAELEESGADIQAIVCDYLELDEGEGWVLLLDDDRLYVKYGSHLGFTCDRQNAELFVSALCNSFVSGQGSAMPSAVHLVADDEVDLAALRALIPENIQNNATTHLYEQKGGFWDVVNLDVKPVMDYRTGNLARKLPFGQWWLDWKVPAIAASVAFLVAVGATFGELRQAKSEAAQLFAERDTIFRQVVPTGSISDPVRQLKAKLGQEVLTEPSKVVYLVSKVAPQIRNNADLKITSFRYTQNNSTLQLNVEAKDFAMLENLRGKIAESGLSAEIKSSRVSGDIQQAQISVTES